MWLCCSVDAVMDGWMDGWWMDGWKRREGGSAETTTR